MSQQHISGLALGDRRFNSYGQDNVPITDSNFTGSPGVSKLIGGMVTSGGDIFAHGDACMMRFNTAGQLMVDTELSVSGVEINNIKVFSTDGTVAQTNYGLTGTDGVVYNNVAQIGSTAVNVNAGAVGDGTQRITLASDDPAVTSLELIDDTVKTAGTDTYTEASTKVIAIGAVRNDAGDSLVDTDQEITPLQVNAYGMLNTNLDMIRDVAPDVNTGALSAGTQRMTLATDDPGVVLLGTIDTDTGVIASDTTSIDAKTPALGTAAMAASVPVTIASDDVIQLAIKTAVEVMDDWDAIEDSAVGTDGAQIMFEARTADKTAVDNGDAVTPVANEYGESIIAGYSRSIGGIRVAELDPLSTHYLSQSLADTTDVSAATHYYPSATGMSLDGYKDLSLSGKFIDADGTLTLTLEASNDEDTTNADWVDVTKSLYDVQNDTNGNASYTVTNDTLLFALNCDEFNFKHFRWVVVASGATNTVILKQKVKAL